MIYIFSGCQNICSLPGVLCSLCGQACKSCPGACKAVSEPFQKCCANCGGYTKGFFEMPLSVYVLVSIVVSGLVAMSCNEDMNGKAKGANGPCTSNFLYLVMVFSII